MEPAGRRVLARAPAAQLGSRAGARKGVLVGSLHGLGFLEEGLVSQKTPAGAPLHSPLSPPSEHQSLCQPLAWLRALTCRGEAVGGHSAIGGGFPRARTGSLLSGITECTLAASPHIRSLCPPHPRPGEDPASENGQGLPEGAGPIIGVSEGQTSNTVAVSLWASQPEVQASLTRHLRSARTVVTLGPVCPHAHLLPGLCKGPGASSPKPTQPPHAGTHTHTHVSSPHSRRWSHSLWEGPAPRPTQLPPTSYSPPNVRACFGVRSDCGVGKGLGAAVDAVPRDDHGGHDDGQRQHQRQQDQADRGPAALGHGSDRPRGEGRQVGTQLVDREVHREAGS